MPAQLDFKALTHLFPADSVYVKEFGWTAIAGTVLLGFGKEPMIADLIDEALSQAGSDETSQCKALRKIREAMLKASPLVGFPRSINGLAVFRKTIEAKVPSIAALLEQDKPLRAAVTLEERHRRGKDFFSKIYVQHTERVLTSMNQSSGGDLGEFAINCIYGDLVAETAILGEKETGLLEFVACLTLMAAPQAKGHMYGSHNLGNTGAEVQASITLVETIAKSISAPWSTEGMDFLEKSKKW